jgi:hypothetical protein
VELFGNIFGDQPDAEPVGCFAMQPDRRIGGLERCHALRHETGDHAAQHRPHRPSPTMAAR